MQGGGGKCPSSACSHLGVPKPILFPVHVDGAQKLLRSIFAVNKLSFGDGTGIEDPVPAGQWGVGSVVGQSPASSWVLQSRGGGVSQGRRGSGPQSWEGDPSMQFPEGCTLLLSAPGASPLLGPTHSGMTHGQKDHNLPEDTWTLECHQGLRGKSLLAVGRAHRKLRKHLTLPPIWLRKPGQA